MCLFFRPCRHRFVRRSSLSRPIPHQLTQVRLLCFLLIFESECSTSRRLVLPGEPNADVLVICRQAFWNSAGASDVFWDFRYVGAGDAFGVPHEFLHLLWRLLWRWSLMCFRAIAQTGGHP